MPTANTPFIPRSPTGESETMLVDVMPISLTLPQLVRHRVKSAVKIIANLFFISVLLQVNLQK